MDLDTPEPQAVFDLRGASGLCFGTGGLGAVLTAEVAWIPRPWLDVGLRYDHGFQTMLFSGTGYKLASAFVGVASPANPYMQPYAQLGGGVGRASYAGPGTSSFEESPMAPAMLAGVGLRGVSHRFEWYVALRAAGLAPAGFALSVDNGLAVRLGRLPPERIPE